MDKAERRHELLRAARDVFATKGYHDAKIDDIVAAAKVAKGTFYLYFPDKRSVFSELVDGLFQRLGAAILRSTRRATSRRRSSTTSARSWPCSSTIRCSRRSCSRTRRGSIRRSSTKIRSFYDGVKRCSAASLDGGPTPRHRRARRLEALRDLHDRRAQRAARRGRDRRAPPARGDRRAPLRLPSGRLPPDPAPASATPTARRPTPKPAARPAKARGSRAGKKRLSSG